jgi:hypothetical protein
VMSQNQSRFGASARNCRFTRSSCVAISGFRPRRLRRCETPTSRISLATRFRATRMPSPSRSSASTRGAP